MRRAAGYAIAWCGATALAVGVSWLGVRDVLRSAILDEAPLAPVVAVGAPASPTLSPGSGTPATPAASPTSAPPSPSRSPAQPRATAAPTRRPVRTSPQVHPTPPTETAGSVRSSDDTRPRRTQEDETLHTFTLKGGRATIAVTSRNCHVVTATPNDGWEVKVWENPQWLRVAFLRDTHESSAFCTWNALPPRLDTYEN